MAVQPQGRCSDGRKRKSDHQTPLVPKLRRTAEEETNPKKSLNLSSDLHSRQLIKCLSITIYIYTYHDISSRR